MSDSSPLAPVQPRSEEPDWAALVALDWADQTHAFKLLDRTTARYEQGMLSATPAALNEWINELGRRFNQRPIAVALEQSRGSLVYQLVKYPQLVLYPVHPNRSAQFRQALHPSGSKSDPNDAAVLLELLEHHRQHLRQLAPESADTRELHMLVEHRRRLVDEKTAWSNRLTAALKSYFPQALEWFSDIDSPLACDFLQQWPSLGPLHQTKPNTLNSFFRKHHCRGEQRIQQRIQSIYQAQPAVTDPALISAGSITVTNCVRVIQSLAEGIANVEQRLKEVVGRHPETYLYVKLPGVAAALLPRLICAFGTLRERYQNANHLQCHSGVAPVTERSGKTCLVRCRRACPKFLRQTFVEFAGHSIKKSKWAKAFYESKRAANMGHHAALRELAFKWQRILFRCWKDGRPYDEQTYLQALEKHHSPLATQVEWTKVAGFSKPMPKKS